MTDVTNPAKQTAKSNFSSKLGHSHLSITFSELQEFECVGFSWNGKWKE